ncbi:polysaccharide biosynthesis protein [Clostridium chauvoei]|uniref:UDP-glucose 4-epimerase n=2 Tax=Clostridium chauvoei TaxID=46867 RepID=S6FK47_9CLOT|nr:polysaccharide biosynthesis protein [Clostridium chauvoei]ATD54386.1 UDP-glucose 4-epimerase [Clostridium chauvoei]ATD57931.1 UDP-glucose 4-epimerase [Clostridium chauvoei]MBX7279722.1 polysaccharide biosynthesis protein [Clostridium chauvoei]MBX7282091.1 polysaccharide biosynthesis protein [Clostridium chauvoei]MBX7284613.1 polysaccharide biosynthesis protein [Clostridium chauvoei]
MFKDKVLLITGGTGSFGHTVLKRFIDTDIKEIRIFSRDEKKQDDMRTYIKSEKVKYYIGDVRDFESINHAMRGVDYVFHAAALKQVPSCEFYPMEAIKTNVQGSDNVFKAAIENKVSKVILLSTDKAVYPVNAMGMSKALAEKVMIARAREAGESGENSTVFCATRYGNVMASRGSVIPLFIKQIKEGKDLTVTDPNMTRYLMSLEESVDLVLYAYEHGRQGDIFVQKAPACTVLELATAVKEVFNSNAGIKIIGPRHGEKSYETLLTKEEFVQAIDHGNYFQIPSDNRDLNYAKYVTEGNEKFRADEEYNSDNTNRVNVEEVKRMLLKLPYIQYELNNGEADKANLTELV